MKKSTDNSEVLRQFMGVRQIWVHSLFRRRGYAGFLLDTARREFMHGGVRKACIAFSQPTQDGSSFAFSYCNKPCILVYAGSR